LVSFGGEVVNSSIVLILMAIAVLLFCYMVMMVFQGM
jgi:hypothetical protein